MSYKLRRPKPPEKKALPPPGQNKLRPGLRSRLGARNEKSLPINQSIIPINSGNGLVKESPQEIPFTGVPLADMGSTGGKVGENALAEEGSSAGAWAMVLILLSALVWGAGLFVGYQTSLAILFGIGFLLAIVGLFVPPLGLLAIGMLCALDSVANIFLLTGGILRFNTLNYWLLIVIALYLPFILRLRDLSTRTLQLFLLIIALYLVFSTDLSRGMQDVLNIAATFGLVVYFARALRDQQIFYWLGVVNGVVAGLGGLIFFLQFDQLPYANPNDWTYFHMTALFSICIAFPYARRLNKSKLVLLFLAVVNFAWIFLSGSRGSLVVALLCVAYLFLATRSITWSSVMLIFALLIGVWVSANFVEQQLYTIQRIQLLFDENLSESRRTSQRSEIAEAGIAIFNENPLGIGTGSFAKAAEETTILTSRRPAHSAWIKTLAENGVIGITLMVVFILSFAVNGIRQKQEGMLLFGVFITLVLIAAFVAKEFRGKSLWFLVASGIVLLNPQQILELIKIQTRQHQVNQHLKLMGIRFGRKRYGR